MAEGSEKQNDQYMRSSAAGTPPRDAQCARTTDGILEQFEREVFADRQVTEPRPFTQVAPVKKDIAAIGKADETVSLAKHQCHDPARARTASLFRGLRHGRPSRHRLPGGAARLFRHVLRCDRRVGQVSDAQVWTHEFELLNRRFDRPAQQLMEVDVVSSPG